MSCGANIRAAAVTARTTPRVVIVPVETGREDVPVGIFGDPTRGVVSEGAILIGCGKGQGREAASLVDMVSVDMDWFGRDRHGQDV